MISIDDARGVLLAALEEMRDTSGIDAVPVVDRVAIESFWVQGYQSREYVDNGHTAVNTGTGAFFVNSTRETLVVGGRPIPSGAVLTQLVDG